MKRLLLGAFAALCWSGAASAQEAYISEIKLMAANFCPRGTLPADGRLLPISSNSALFSLLGTLYGGDGRTTFGLPDLRGRVPISVGQGPGLSGRAVGERGGAETVTISSGQMPSHTHSATGQIKGLAAPATSPNPSGNKLALATSGSIYANSGNEAAMAADGVAVAVQPAGGGAPVPNMQPYLTMTYCIATVGIFPSRN